MHPFRYCSPNDFRKMVEPQRYSERSDLLRVQVSKSVNHFWDPFDERYINFAIPFDVTQALIIDPIQIDELQTSVAAKLSKADQIKLGNDIMHFYLSQLLHGEQAALIVSSNLSQTLLDPGIQEFAANQATEEARHVSAFSKYISIRFGSPMPMVKPMQDFVCELLSLDAIDKKIAGMQLLIEGLAVGVFKIFGKYAVDPVLKRLLQLVLIDESHHHQFGKTWAEYEVGDLDPSVRNELEDWTVKSFLGAIVHLISPTEKADIYQKYNFTAQEMQVAMHELFTPEKSKQMFVDKETFLYYLMKSLSDSGILTRRSAKTLGFMVDFDELAATPDDALETWVPEDVISELKKINEKKQILKSL